MKKIMIFFLISGTLSLNAQEKLPKYGKDSVECVKNLSLYREYAKQKNYTDALLGWRYVFNHCPGASKNIYIDGVKIFHHKIKNASDQKIKEAYLDTLMMIYDRRIQYFDQEGFVLGRKGTDLVRFGEEEKIEEAYNYLKKSYELMGDKTEAGVLVALFTASVKMEKYGKIPKEEVVSWFEKATKVIDANKEGKYAKYYKKTAESIEKMAQPYLSCDVLIKMYQEQYEENKDNTEWLRNAVNLLSAKKCTEADLFGTIAEQYYSLEPSVDAAVNLAQMFIGKKQYSKALNYLKDAMDQEKDPEKLQKIYLLAATAALGSHQNSLAASYARKALALNPKNGNAYILIGDAIVNSSKDCGQNEFEQKAIYWLAVDYYIKAKNVDPDVAEIANKKIATYRQYFPNKENAFFYGVKEGDSYTVGCWINETTKARF
jgi:tetratricopeptide (TPR) repeat protein